MIDSPEEHNKFITRAGILGFLILALLLASIITFGRKHTIAPTTFVNTPATVASNSSWLPSFDGFDNLTAQGVTSDQLTGLKYAFGLYAKTLGSNNHTVTVKADTIKTLPLNVNTPSANSTLTFNATIDKTTYVAHVTMSLISADCSLTLSDGHGVTVYDSGNVNINTQNPAV